MKEDSRDKAIQNAVERIRSIQSEWNADLLAANLISGEVKSLSQAITLSESTNAEHQRAIQQVILQCLPYTGKSIRIGITGVPGVGKSTLIEAFGLYLVNLGHKVAVLAIDPTSPFSHGSILGDKTRMDKLSIHPSAFIRPTPSSLNPGGVARHTRESIMLCEAAGFDIVIVETVGVGQGEVAVHGMTDFFLLLMLAGAGDQLQGIKRGIMELCDGILITKCDGENKIASQRAKTEYLSALHLFPPRESGWMPRVDTVSAIESEGLNRSWQMISDHVEWMKSRNLFNANRKRQDIAWMHESLRHELLERLLGSEEMKLELREWEMRVESGSISPFEAATKLSAAALKSY